MSQSLSSKQYSHAARSFKEALIYALILDNVKEIKTLKRPSSESLCYQNNTSSIQVKYLFFFFCMVRYKEFRVRYPATYFSDYKNMLARSVFIWACEYYVVHETVLGKKKTPHPLTQPAWLNYRTGAKRDPWSQTPACSNGPHHRARWTPSPIQRHLKLTSPPRRHGPGFVAGGLFSPQTVG